MYESKVKLLLQAAKLYGEDKGGTSVSVEQLINDNYITCDDNADANDCILNPRNNKSMKDCKIIISTHSASGRVSTSWDTNNTPATLDESCNWK